MSLIAAPILEAIEVSKSYGNRLALDDVTLAVKPGEIVPARAGGGRSRRPGGRSNACILGRDEALAQSRLRNCSSAPDPALGRTDGRRRSGVARKNLASHSALRGYRRGGDLQHSLYG